MSNLEDKYETIKQDLDKKLDSSPKDVGIRFGGELFNIFKERGWFEPEIFSVSGTELFPHETLAYKKTHAVSECPTMGDIEFEIGSYKD